MIKTVVVLSLLLAMGLTADSNADFCWKNSYGRGAGAPLSLCKGNQEKNGALCYNKCHNGYYGAGPVCWTRCEAGYHDDGAFCRRDAHVYGKGCCCIAGKCCKGTCKAGYQEDPCTCRKDAHIVAKKSYGRGAGNSMSCPNNQDQDAGLCYNKCKKDFKGVGPVCWGKCPSGWVDCGAACGRDKHECADKIIEMITETGFAIANSIAMVVGASPATKAAQQAAKVAKIAAKSAKLAAKIAKYANDIFNKAKERGEPISEAEAKNTAEATLGKFMDGIGTGGAEGWEAAWETVAKVDPTGLLAAAKAFYHPLCDKVK